MKLVFIVVIVGHLTTALHAALNLEITGNYTSSVVELNFSGTGTVSNSPNGVSDTTVLLNTLGGRVTADSEVVSLYGGVNSVEYNFFEPLAPTYSYFDSSEGTLLGTPVAGIKFIDNGINGLDYFEILLSDVFTPENGDQFSWSGSYTLDLAEQGQSGDIFKPGAYDLELYEIDIPTSATITSVPEPSSCTLFGLTSLVFLSRRSRKINY